jgi:3-hydroxymyristoyl/3-hydroxydecanoyl-(acyl carrier protein) dehydratase
MNPEENRGRVALPTSLARPLRALPYFGLLAILFWSADPRIDTGALLALVTVVLAPALARRVGPAWGIWSCTVLVGGSLLAAGHAALFLHLVPFAVGIGLCLLFARSLARGRVPFIARAIIATDGPHRLALPGVAAYAHGLTLAWTLFFGIQAATALGVALFVVPDGLLAILGKTGPLAWTRADAVAIHLASVAAVVAFFGFEYAYRRWHLRHVAHLPAHVFFARLVQRWPELVRPRGPATSENPGTGQVWTTTLSIPAAHPALPGHFPGNPVVPGVVLLDRVAAALEDAGQGGLRRIATVKFLAPLRADCEVGLRLQVDDRRVRFAMDSEGRTILRGEGERA